MTTGPGPQARPTSVVDRWRSFWFTPESAGPLGVVRITFGVLVVGWTLSLLPDLTDLFGNGSVVPASPTVGYEWSVFDAADGSGARLLVWGVLLVASVALTVGWHSRVAALLVFVGVMSFERANPFVFNSGDALIRLEAAFLVLAPTGAAFSLDRRRTVGSFWSAEIRVPWVLRLLQVQLTLIYGFSVLNKLSGDTWREGTAVSYALRMTDIGNFSFPEWITGSGVLINVLTWAVLFAELSIGVLVWNRRARPWVLGLGVVFHAVLVITFGIAFFSFAIWILYLAFVPPEVVAAWFEDLPEGEEDEPDGDIPPRQSSGAPPAGSAPGGGG